MEMVSPFFVLLMLVCPRQVGLLVSMVTITARFNILMSLLMECHTVQNCQDMSNRFPQSSYA